MVHSTPRKTRALRSEHSRPESPLYGPFHQIARTRKAHEHTSTSTRPQASRVRTTSAPCACASATLRTTHRQPTASPDQRPCPQACGPLALRWRGSGRRCCGWLAAETTARLRFILLLVQMQVVAHRGFFSCCNYLIFITNSAAIAENSE